MTEFQDSGTANEPIFRFRNNDNTIITVDGKGNFNTATTPNTQTDSYTLVLSDAGGLIIMNSGSANNLTVPPNASVPFPTGTSILILQYGAGQTTIVAGSGVTIRSYSSLLNIAGQYAGASLVKIGTNEWVLQGTLA